MRSFAKHRPFDAGFLLGVVLSGLIYTWVLAGGFPLAARAGSRQHYYTFAAMSLLHGRLDVPEAALAGECFLLDGRCYGYFGITPSLLRLPVALIAGDRSFSNHVESVFFLLGFLATAAGLWWLTRQLVAGWAASASRARLGGVGFAVATTLAASPLLFLASRPLVYEEAILWGVAFGMLALGAAISVRSRPRPSTIAVLLLADVLGVLARPSVGASGILATLYVGYRLLQPEGRRHRAAGGSRMRYPVWGSCLVVGATVAFASAPAMAYAKFGTPAPPYQYHSIVANSPQLFGPLSHRGGVNAAAIPTKLLSSLRPDTLRLLRHAPYIALGEEDPAVIWPAKPSDVAWETTAGIPASLPFTALAAFAGLGWVVMALRRRGQPPAGGLGFEMTLVLLMSACVGVGVQLVFPGNTYRYLADWLPFLAVGSTIGLAAAAARRSSRPRRQATVTTVGAVLLAAQLVIQVGLAVQNGLDTGGEHPAICGPGGNPYGKLGEIFCPLET